MAITESFTYSEDWLELESLTWTGQVTTSLVESLTSAKKFKVSIEVIVPAKVGIKKFKPEKSVVINQFKSKWQSAVAEHLSTVIEQKVEEMNDPEPNKKKSKKETASLDGINKSIEKSFVDFRTALKKAIIAFLEAVNDDNEIKAGDLTTISSIDFKPIEWIKDGFEIDTSKSNEMLEIRKCLKRKMWQYCAVAWKNKVAVLSIRLKKPFKAAELKELRDCLPDGSTQGAIMVGGRILAFSETKVQFEFPANLKPPIQALKSAFKEQLGKSVFIDKKFGDWDSNAKDDGTEEKLESNKSNAKEEKDRPPKPPKSTKPST